MTDRGVLLVRTGGRELGLMLRDVIEVSDHGAVWQVPARLPAFRGVIQVRGKIVALLHLGALLGESDCPAGPPSQTMVLVAAGRWHFALEVDSADAAPDERILPPPEGTGFASWASGAVQRGGGWVPVLNVEALTRRWQEAAA